VTEPGSLSGRSVLVTGGAGFIGVPVVRRLLEAGAAVSVLDNFAAGSADRLAGLDGTGGLVVREVDLRDAAATAAAIGEAEPAVCVHLAAIHFIPLCRAHPADTLAVNVLGTQHVLDGLRSLPVAPRFVLASTADVYRPQEAPHDEDAPTNPDNVYGLSKLAAESLVRLAAAEGVVDPIIARFFNVYGPGETNPHLIPEICGQLQSGRVLRLGNLAAKRDYVFVDDLADVVVALAASDASGGTVNVGTGASYSGSDVIDVMAELLGSPITVEVNPARLRPSDRPVLQADATRLRRLLPGACSTTMAGGLRRLFVAEGLL